jgi:hypothetical protein
MHLQKSPSMIQAWPMCERFSVFTSVVWQPVFFEESQGESVQGYCS